MEQGWEHGEVVVMQGWCVEDDTNPSATHTWAQLERLIIPETTVCTLYMVWLAL